MTSQSLGISSVSTPLTNIRDLKKAAGGGVGPLNKQLGVLAHALGWGGGVQRVAPTASVPPGLTATIAMLLIIFYVLFLSIFACIPPFWAQL